MDSLKNKTLEVFNQFNTITLHFYLDHVILDPSSSTVMVRWEGEWIPLSESPLKNGGNTLLKFSIDPVPHLVEIQGINPFIFQAKEKKS